MNLIKQNKTTRTGLKRWFTALILVSVLGFNAMAQVTVTNPGNTTPGLAATYTSLANAITALNAQTAISGPVTISLTAGNPQTAPSGGYAITALLTGASSTNTVTIDGGGNTITAPNPAGTSGALTDAIFKFIGSDFMTLQNFIMNENVLNTTTTAASNNMVEWGVALLYATTTNGAQNITIQNNTITLNRTYQNTFGIYSNSTHSSTAVSTTTSATTTAGSNSNTKIYSNNISNVNMGIVIVGPTAAADANTGIDIGGGSNLTGNTFTNFGTTGTFSSFVNVSGTVNGILVRNSNGFNISYNSITSSAGGTTSGTLNGIQIPAASATPTTTFTNNINNNTIALQSGVASGAINGINYPSGSASSTSVLNVNNNNFTQLNHSVAASGTISGTILGSSHLTFSLSGNTFTNLTTNTTGSFTFLGYSYSMAAGGTQSINNNSIVTGFNKTGAGGTVTCLTTGGSSPNGTTHTQNNNNFSNITVTGATGIAGIVNNDGAGTSPTKTCTGNTFSNWTGGTSSITVILYAYIGATTSSISSNTVSNITAQAAITGISITNSFAGATTCNIASNSVTGLTSSGAGGAVAGITCSNTSTNININNNTVSGLSTTAGSTVQGIVASGATLNNIFKNTVCDLSGSAASSTVSGIVASAGTTNTIYNNRIADLRAPSANAANPIIGLSITGGTTVNAYYNTVYLSAAAGGALFGSSAVSVSTTPTVTLRNNIFVNTSVTNGAGLAVAHRRSSTTLTTYASASNNNMFYSTSAYYTDGTNTDATFNAYKTRVSTRDAASFSELPPFLSTTCGNSNFLKINTATPTQAESGGATISGITDDFEGDTRNVTTPDLGADEFAGIAADLTAPSINYIPLAFTCSTSARTITATITDASGVPTSGPGLPVLYWSINNSAGPFTAATGTFTGGNNYSFTFGSGVVSGNTVYYYIVAQDNAGTPNVIASPSTGAAGYTANPPAVATPPSGPSAYNISNTIGGTYTVGAAGNYPTLTAAVNAYNASCLSSAVVFELTDPTYSGSETFPITIGSNPDASATNTLTIRPASGNVATITGAVANNSLLRFTSARYITIDGSNSGGSDQSLTISNTSTTAPTAFSMVSMGSSLGVTNGTIKNCILNTGTVTTGASYGISVGATTPGNSQVDNDNVTIQNNAITGATIGIYAVGGASVSAGGQDNLLITGNSVTTNTTLATLGIQVGNALNSTVSQNTVSVTTTASSAPVGISLETGFVSSTVTRNNITNVSTTATGGYGGRGIAVGTGTATSSLTISNNFISGVNGLSWTSFGNSASMGIAIGMVGNSTTITTTAGGINVYHNTVNMYGNQPAGGYAGSSVTAALYIGTGASALDVRNNILVNSQNNPNGSGTGSKNYAIYSAAANTAFTSINYNDYYVSGTQGVLGFISSDRTNLAAIVTGFGQNANSVNIAPVFTSSSDLHLDINNNSSLNDIGISIAGVTVDYDGTTRSATPDMGADEFTPPSCVAAVGGTASGSTAFCISGTPTISATGYSTGLGSTYQWMFSTNAGDYPLAGTAVSGQTNPATLTTGVVSSTTYYWLVVTCATNSSTDYSNMITITVNPSAASISGASSKCANDPAVTLTETGGTGTSWLWSTSETTQSISVNPSSTTTYTVTVTSPGSCTATATKTVTVNANPTGVTAASDLSTICNGTSINLTSSANSPSPTILTQNFESGIGSWVITAASTGGATPALANFNIRAHGWASGGSTPVVMNSPGGTNFIFADPDGAGSGVSLNTQLTSPSFSTVGYTAASLDFRHYFRYITSAQTVQISTDGGTVWTTIQTYSATVGGPTAFASASISLNAYLGQPNVKIRFNYTGGWIWYWAIDDISITGTPAAYTYSWASTPSGFTSAVQNPTGVTPTVSTDYTVTVTASNGCTASASTGVVTVNNYPVADAPANVTACDSYVLPALSVGNYFSGSGGTGTAYSAGNTISASMTMYVYAESGTTPNCTDENSFTITINNTPVADAPANVTACDSYVLPALSVGNYFSGSGGTGTAYSAGNSISASMTMYVYAETGTTPNCTDENSFTITINNTPVADAPANVTACDSYVLPALSVGNYFSGSGGTGTAYSAGNTITSSMTMYVYAETGTTPNCTDENSFTITINTSPTATISGDANICTGGSTNLTLNFTGTGPWTYAINGGSSVVTSNNPETVSVTPGSTTVYTITSFSNANCSGSVSGSATVTVSPAAPDFIITFQPGPASACVGNTVNLTLNPVNNAQNYTWSAPAGTLINGQVSPVTTTSNSVTVTLGAVPANSSGWNICVFASNPCGISQNKCAFIRGVLSTPAAITGDKTACPNTSGTYSTSAVAGANSYLWTGTNGITFTGSGTSVTANFPAGFTTGTICVAAQLSCGYTGPTRCITVTNNVGTLGAMTGAFAVCPGQTGLVFSVPPVAGAATYTWTAPTGVTITSGAGTNSVTVNVGGTFTVGNICVTATSICGVVSAPRCKTISSIKPGTPGNITGSATGVCNSTVTYSVPAVVGVTSYNWTLPSGATFATANGTNTVDVTFSNSFTTGQLCVTAINGCGASTPRCINVKGAPAIPGVISAPGVICANEQGTVFSVSPVFGTTTYTWAIPANATLVAGQGTNSIVVDWGANGGLVTVTASNGCGNSGTRTYLVTLTCRSASTELPGVTVSAYPNPVSNTLTVAMDTPSEGNFSMTMTDLTGRIMFGKQLKAVSGLNETAVDVSNLAKGIYMLTVTNESGFTKQIRVTVQ